jgi:hypothetical protein
MTIAINRTTDLEKDVELNRIENNSIRLEGNVDER